MKAKMFRNSAMAVAMLAALFVFAPRVRAAGISSNGTGGGNWSATTTWVGGVVPGASDDVTIANSDLVTLDTTSTISSLTVGQGISGTLTYQITTTVRSLTVNGDVLVASGATFNAGVQTGTVTHTLILNGNLTVNGTFDMTGGGTTKRVQTTFSGGSNVAISGSPITLKFSDLIVNLGSSGTTITPSANLSTAGGGLTLTQGRWIQNSVTTTTTGTWGTITGELSIGGGTVTVNNGSITNSKKISITSGTLNAGSTSGNALTNNSSGTFDIQGGTLNIASRFINSGGSMTISSGTVNVATVGISGTNASFELTVSSNFTMTGGVVAFQNSNGGSGGDLKILNTTGAKSISGGAFQIGNGSTGTNPAFQISSAVPIYNLTINHPNGVSLNGAVTVNNTLALLSGDLNTGANTLTLASTATTTGTTDVVGTVLRSHTFSPSTNYAFGNPNNLINFSSVTNGASPSIALNLSKTKPAELTRRSRARIRLLQRTSAHSARRCNSATPIPKSLTSARAKRI